MKRSEVLAIAGHGAAIVVHFLGAVWNRLESGTWIDREVGFHGVCVGFSLTSLIKHVRRASGKA